MKITALIQGFHVAASRYRVLQYLPYMKDQGMDVIVQEFPQHLGGWFELLQTMKGEDTLFVQRKRIPLPVLYFLKRKNVKVVYDFDDAVMFKNSLSPNPHSLRRRLSFKRMLKYSHLVIAGNRFLKEEAEKYHKNVKILPTPIDGNRYIPKTYKKKNTVNIGWIGDHGSIHYMESYKDIWKAVGKRYGNRVMLTIICDTFIETENITINKVQWSLDKEIEDLQALDIGIMPLFDDLWSKGKCGFKIIQYMGVGLPVVCTPVGINRDVVKDGVNGLWANTKEEWIEGLSKLIEDDMLREKMGKEGRRMVIEQYTVQSCAPLLIRWLKGFDL
jgi:glycosyltransferase involved in cell wall biosynthesis